MTHISILKLSDLRGPKRIDAERYEGRYLKLERALKEMQGVRYLKALIESPVRTGQTPRERRTGDEEKVTFLKTDTLREGFIDFDRADYLPRQSVSDADLLRPDEVILTIIGGEHSIIGRAAVFLAHYPKSVVNQNIAVIRPETKLVDPFYLSAFLNSRVGREQLWMLSRQTEQVNLNCREVEAMLVPVPSQQDSIRDLVTESCRFYERSLELYTRAENTILDSLGLGQYSPQYQKHYRESLVRAAQHRRMDAEFFQPCYDELTAYLTKRDHLRIREIQIVNHRGIQPTYVEDGDVKVVTSKHLGRTSIDYENLEKTNSSEWEENCDAQIRLNDVIIYTTGAYVGTTNAFLENSRALASNHINILRVKDLDPLYVAVFLNSLLGQMQVRRHVSGSAQVELYPDDIAKFVLWRAPRPIQDYVSSMVRESFDARKKAKALMQAAKSEIEGAIG